jgi:preprotein translocase subunit SecG
MDRVFIQCLRLNIKSNNLSTNSGRKNFMKRAVFPYFVILLALAVGATFAQEKTKREKKSRDRESTVKGEVVDISCHLSQGKKATGDAHKECAEGCAKAGGPPGILTDKGKLYLSVLPDDHSAGPNAILMDYIAHKVSATGVLRSKGGLHGIMITKVEMVDSGEKEKEGK